jgi:hypothetical protein
MKEPIWDLTSLRWDYDSLKRFELQHEKIPPGQGGIFFSKAEAAENGMGPKSRRVNLSIRLSFSSCFR